MWCYAVVEEVRRSASVMCIIHQGHTSSILTNLIKRTVGLYLKCIINMSNYYQSKNLKNINWRIRLGFNSKWINQIIIDSTPKIEKILMSLSMMKQICSFPQKSIFVYVMWRNLFWRNRSWKCITLKSFASWLVNHHHQGVFCRGRKSLRIYLNAKCEIDAWIEWKIYYWSEQTEI